MTDQQRKILDDAYIDLIARLRENEVSHREYAEANPEGSALYLDGVAHLLAAELMSAISVAIRGRQPEVIKEAESLFYILNLKHNTTGGQKDGV